MKVKQEATGELGEVPEARDLDSLLKRGLINLDKPAGPTSHQVTHWVKKILKIEKAGHGGTLDPNATGVLPIALGKATKVLGLLLKEAKEYVGLVVLHDKVKKSEVKKVLKGLKGKIKQTPPVKSSVKREERVREIYEVELLELEGKYMLFRVKCEAGTYIRKLAHTIGEKLGIRAHLKELRRTKVGPFQEKVSSSLYDLEDGYHFWKEGNPEYLREHILPVEFIIEGLPKIWVLDSAAETIAHGTPLYAPGVSKLTEDIEKGNQLALLTLKGELIGLGQAKMDTAEILKKEKGKVSTIESVIFQPNKRQ